MPIYEIQSNREGERVARDLVLRLRRALLALAATVLVSTIGFAILAEGQGTLGQRLFLGLWETLNLVSTVGSLPGRLTNAERAWSMLVIVIGLGAVLYGFGTMQGLFSSGDVVRYYARSRMQKTLRELKDHIVVCGYGVVGHAVASQMQRAGQPLVIIEAGADAAETASSDGFMVIHGDSTLEETLQQAGVDRAAGLIAALDTDAANVYLTLIARELRPELRIVTRASRGEARSILLRAGADRVIVPGEIAALQLSHLILKPRVSEFVAAATGEGEYDFAEFGVSSFPDLAGKTLGTLRLPEQAEVIVISVIDAEGRQVFNPGPDRRLDQGDTLIVVCREGGLDRLALLATAPPASPS